MKICAFWGFSTVSLGQRLRALPAISLHVVPDIAALLLTVRVAPFDANPFTSSGRILRQRRENAAVARPAGCR
jgi:hypothetical protein